MRGETDLGRLLATLRPARRPGVWTYVTVAPAEAAAVLADDPDRVGAVVAETEGATLVVTTETARIHGWPVGYEAAWLTLTVHSSLEAVGLTAAVASALAEQGIGANVLAGHHHDHLLVPVDRADDALAVLDGLAGRPRAEGRDADG